MAKSKPIKREEELTLTVSDRFYIENNEKLSIEQISKDLNKPEKLIEEYCKSLISKNKKTRSKKLMDRPGKNGGVMSMTEAASMEGDTAYNKYVTLEAINRAMSNGDMELARELKDRYDKQQNENKNIIKRKYSGVIHYIETPDEVY